MNTLILQSHRQPLPNPWLDLCIKSVVDWSASNNFDYRWMGDEIFNEIPDIIKDRTKSQQVVASDLARLIALRRIIDEGYDTVVWCDADFLIFSPHRLVLPKYNFALGREVWVQSTATRTLTQPRAHVKVHNAFMMYRAGNAFLDFYIETAQKLLVQHPGPYVTQFIGPKLLTALHNIVDCPVVETAAVLSPNVVHDLLSGGGPHLQAFNRRSKIGPAAANLCASSVVNGDVSDNDMLKLCALLIESGERVFVA